MIRNTLTPLALLALLAPTLRAEESEPLLGGNLVDIIDKGGLVMIIILVGSVIGLALAMERLFNLRKRLLCPEDLFARVRQANASSDWSGVKNEVEDRKDPLARILDEGLKRMDHGPNDVERTMESVGSHEVAKLKRPVRPIAILATIMPLLGLLGTILGMITTFNMLGDTSPAERVQKLAPGIGQALYTTAAGLCVSIPFVLLHHFLIGRVNRAAEEWSLLGSDLVLALKKNGLGQEATS